MIMRKALWAMVPWFGLAVNGMAAEPENIFGIHLPQSIEEIMSVAHEDPQADFKFRKGYSSYFFQGIQRYEDSRLGYSLAYASPAGTDISVYVYDLGMSHIPDGVDSLPVADELATSSQAIAASGRYARVEEHVGPPALSPHFAQSSHTLTTTGGQRVKSHTLLRGQNGFFVKVRVTGTSQGLERSVDAFLDYLVEDLGIEDEDADGGAGN